LREFFGIFFVFLMYIWLFLLLFFLEILTQNFFNPKIDFKKI
jgi:hypothetical protein